METSPTTWLLTTVDNPYSPFDDFKTWYMEDLRLGYNTCSMIARLSNGADDFNDDVDFAVMRQIIEYNWSGKHVMVTRATWADEIIAPV
jgi:hypothetical protein